MPTVPPTWNTLLSAEDFYVAFADSTVMRVGTDPPVVVAGRSGTPCADGASPCGDGGPATAGLLGDELFGLAVGLDGSLYIADTPLRRVRKVDPSGVIRTVAGTGADCVNEPCGDGGPATTAQLSRPLGVAVDPYGVLLIADGPAGIRRVAADGTITTLTRGSDNYQSVAIGIDGTIYATTQISGQIVQVDPTNGAVTPVVGTGTPGYNGTTTDNGSGFFCRGSKSRSISPASCRSTSTATSCSPTPTTT